MELVIYTISLLFMSILISVTIGIKSAIEVDPDSEDF